MVIDPVFVVIDVYYLVNLGEKSTHFDYLGFILCSHLALRLATARRYRIEAPCGLRERAIRIVYAQSEYHRLTELQLSRWIIHGCIA